MNNIKDAENILTTILQMSKEEQALVMGFIEGIKYDFTEMPKATKQHCKNEGTFHTVIDSMDMKQEL